ncbi:LLM class flavin-dependent oxidoreductase [Nonomuraea sp. NN258]|uniref:LLM class flavin-dependent oxidoreductase n=1 Tax=Nonomuraea antri TaxID=2730852 RepID=UPI00156A3E09|nr:LLM class flavin-dependent oxidoreductase [Nonomuraea antri]NRQ33076.1 LLM class flavin-dependent oxidoreductase [Nonomuraea antri]
MHDTGIRFGLHSGQQYRSIDECRELWRRAEELGFDLLSVFDHLRPPLGGPAGPCFEGTTLLAAMAASTSRIRCVMLVSAVTWRHPAITAAVAATVDHISGGRLEFGMGAGGPDLGYEQYAIDLPRRPARLEMLDEACEVLRGLWSGRESSFAGTHYRLDRAHLQPPPVQRRLPLVIGGESDEILRIAARHADVWNTIVSDPGEYREKLARLARHCRDAGRDPGEIRKSVTFRAALAGDESEARRRRARLSATLPPEVLREYLTFGTPERCAEDLRVYRELGVGDFVLGARPPIDWTTVELVAREVAPALREAF